MERVIKGKRIQETFWSLAEFADEAGKRADSDHRHYVASRPDWHGNVASMDEAVRLAKFGWTDELPETMAISESAVELADKEHMMESFSQPVWDVTGAQVDVGAYLAGTPECMIDYPLSVTSKVGRVVTLVVGRAVSGSVSVDTIVRRGRLVVALALALNQLGHAVEMWADHADQAFGDRGMTLYQRVLVKGASDELDPAQIMFALAHPAMVRALFFGSWDGFPEPFKESFARDSCRGLPMMDQDKNAKTLYPEGAIFLPGLRSSTDIPNADVFLRKHLGELGLLAE